MVIGSVFGRRSLWLRLVFTIGVFTVLLSACGDGDDGDDDDDDVETSTETEATEPASESTVSETATGEPASTATGESSAEFDEDAVADFYRGKTITILVGFSAGGGYDLQARLIAEHIGQYIPGNPTVIVENMEGAGSLVAWNHMYSAGPTDGTLIGYSAGSQILQQVLGNPAVEFDAQQVQYLGAHTQDTFVLVVTNTSGVTDIEQILPPDPEEELTLGGTAPGSTSADVPLVLEDVLGANINLITGYDGNAAIALAMESGEIEGFSPGLDSLRSAYAEQFENDWSPLVTLTEERVSDLGDVPAILEFAPDASAEQVITYGIIRPAQFIRPLVVAADVPEDRVLALSRAIEQLAEDETYQTASADAGLQMNPLTGDQLRAFVEDFFAMPEDVRARLQELLAP
ncbi:MAG: hypothetical protein GEU28_02375 [Dehalococcoidia bacterium]|nr:hypothetical protein [Dehalococcoidia bacterium]